MPTRLAGAKARFIEKHRSRSFTGLIKAVNDNDLTVIWNDQVKPPIFGLCDIVTFANEKEYSFQATTLGGDEKKAVLRVTSAIKEMPMGKNIHLLNDAVSAVCRLGKQEINITLVAACADAFAFESKDILPMDDSTTFALLVKGQELPLKADLNLQRFEAGSYRGLATITEFDRLTDMHWHRLLKS